MNQLNPTPINPKGFTNTNNIQGVFGTQVPNTFTRDVNGMNDAMNPMANELTSQPIPPPAGVETPITPNYNINNY
jgi:hypothetical protein